MKTVINSVTLSRSEQCEDGSWSKVEVSARDFKDFGETVKELVGEINFALVELDEGSTAPATPEADEAVSAEVATKPLASAAAKKKEAAETKKADTAAKKADAAAKKKEAAEKKKAEATKKKEVAYDRTNETLKKKFAGAVVALVPEWKTECKSEVGGMSKSLDGVAMLDSDGEFLSSFTDALKEGLKDFLPSVASEEEDGL